MLTWVSIKTMEDHVNIVMPTVDATQIVVQDLTYTVKPTFKRGIHRKKVITEGVIHFETRNGTNYERFEENQVKK